LVVSKEGIEMLGCNMEGVNIIGNYSLNQCGIR
jgi:hypothetical protein